MVFKDVSQSLRDLRLDLGGPQAVQWDNWWDGGAVAYNLMATLSLEFIQYVWVRFFWKGGVFCFGVFEKWMISDNEKELEYPNLGTECRMVGCIWRFLSVFILQFWEQCFLYKSLGYFHKTMWSRYRNPLASNHSLGPKP